MLYVELPKSFRNALRAFKAILKGATSPVDASIRLASKGGVASFTAVRDGRVLTLEVPAKGRCADVFLPGVEFLKALNGAKSFTFDHGTIETPKGQVSLTPVEPGDAPLVVDCLHVSEGTTVSFRLEAGPLELAKAGTSPDLTKPTLSRVLVDLREKGRIRLVGTDGFWMNLAQARAVECAPGERDQALVDRTTLGILADLGDGQTVALTLGRDSMTFRGDGWTLTAPEYTYAGHYPDYHKLLPAEQTLGSRYTFAREPFREGVLKAGKLRDDYNRKIRLFLADDGASLEFFHPDKGTTTAWIGLETQSAPIELGFDVPYLESLSSLLPGEKVTYSCANDTGIGVWRGQDSGAWSLQVLLMPVKFSERCNSPEAIRDRIAAGRAAQTSQGGIPVSGKRIGLLERLIGKVLPTADRRRRLPVLSSVFLGSRWGRVQASMANMELFLTLDLAESEDAIPDLLLDCDDFRNALKGAESLALESGRAVVGGVEIRGNAPEHYPVFPEVHGAQDLEPIMHGGFPKDMLAFAASCASRYEMRKALHGVALDFADGKARLVGTDGFLLAVADLDARVDDEAKGTIILPLDAVQVLSSLDRANPGSVLQVRVQEMFVSFRGDGWTLTVRRIQENFPAYGRVIPAQEDLFRAFRCQRLALKNALQTVAAPMREVIHLEVKGGQGRISADDEEGKVEAAFGVGDASSEVEARLGLHGLKDMIAALPSDQVEVRFGDSGPWMVAPVGAEGRCRAYILPLKVEVAGAA